MVLKAGALPKLVISVKTDDMESQRMAAMALCNLCTNGATTTLSVVLRVLFCFIVVVLFLLVCLPFSVFPLSNCPFYPTLQCEDR
jgi:hypothetical protein